MKLVRPVNGSGFTLADSHPHSGANTTGYLLPSRARLGPGNYLYVLYTDSVGPDNIGYSIIKRFQYTSNGIITTDPNEPREITPNETMPFGDIAVSPVNQGTLLASTIYDPATKTSDLIYTSTDNGVSWSTLNDCHNTSAVPWLTQFENNVRNANSNWINLAFDPSTAGHALYGTGQMIYETTDLVSKDHCSGQSGYVSWITDVAGQEETVVNGLAAPISGSAVLMSAVYDLGGFVHQSVSQSPTYGYFSFGEMGTGVDYSEGVTNGNPTTMAVVGGNNGAQSGTTGGAFSGYSMNGGQSWTTMPSIGTSKEGGGMVAVSQSGYSLVWATYDGQIWNTSYDGSSGSFPAWSGSTGISGSSYVVPDRITNGYFYAMTNAGSLYESTNYGQTFSSLNWNTGGTTNGLASNPDAAGDVWVASSNGLFHVFINGTTVTYSKPTAVKQADAVAVGAEVSGGTGDAIYVVGVVNDYYGVYRSIDAGSTWTQITNGFGTITALAADRRTAGTVYLGTTGRGIIYGTSPN